jgi:lysophospholipase L1-like esterase
LPQFCHEIAATLPESSLPRALLREKETQMIWLTRLFSALALSALCVLPAHADRDMRVLVIGDSFMTSNASAGYAVPHVIQRELHADVKSRALAGARYIYKLPITGSLGMNISRQFRPGNWDWVVINGGGNDLWLGCGCSRCERRLNRLIAPDGSKGEIPTLVARARQSGAKVLYVGYLRSPGVGSPIEHCRAEGDALEGRIAVMAKRDPHVTFVSLADLVPMGDRSFHAGDMIHPSAKGSVAAGARIADAIRAAGR